jgi:RNA-directed DNA polymerase
MNTVTKLQRITWLSSKDNERVFECVMHHINDDLLRDNFRRLEANKAKGIDGVSKEDYGKNLDENLRNLLDEMKRMAYKPRPVKETLIPKEGQPGKFRPLGISNFEDKIVQGAFRQILEAIYEPLFLDCSHGFRPKRSCHTAIKDLRKYLYEKPVETVIDIDLKNFFGTIDHKILEGFLREKITDEKFIRYIIRMFKAGVLSKDELTISAEGVPQGSICSPILANIFAHKVLDEWVEKIIQPYCEGKVKLFRYADDAIICCEIESDAKRIRESLPNRLSKYKLTLNEEKTNMVNFSKTKAQQGLPQESFDFLGFTFYWGKTRKGRVIPKLKTSGKRMNNKLEKVGIWIKDMRNKVKLKELWGTFCAKLRGHTQYYGVSFNSAQIQKFSWGATGIFFKWINRRSQRKSFTWKNFEKFMERFPLPKVKICHKLY